MNNLLQIREKIKRANRLHEAQILATKSGEVTPYTRSVFEERISKTQKEMKLKDMKTALLNVFDARFEFSDKSYSGSSSSSLVYTQNDSFVTPEIKEEPVYYAEINSV